MVDHKVLVNVITQDLKSRKYTGTYVMLRASPHDEFQNFCRLTITIYDARHWYSSPCFRRRR